MSYRSLQTNYTADSLTWDFMAKRELEASVAGEELLTARGRAADINRREERCCQVYEEGVKSLNTGRGSNTHVLIWAIFLNHYLCEVSVQQSSKVLKAVKNTVAF